MSAASKADYLIPLIYAAAADSDVWPALPGHLADHIDADAVLLCHVPSEPMSPGRFWTHGLDSAAVAAFMEDGVIDQSRFASALLVLPGEPFTEARTPGSDAGLVDEHGSSILLRPQQPLDGQVGTRLRRAGMCWTVAYFAGPCRGPLDTDRHRLLLESLLPHLRRAAALQLRLVQLRDDALILAEALELLALGVLTVDADLAVLFANEQALATMARGDGLHRSAGRLALGDPALLQRLKAAVAPTAAGQAKVESACLCVRRPSGAPPLTLVVTPVATGQGTTVGRPPGTAAIILVTDPASQERLPPAAHLAQRFDLTATEAAVARLAAMGRGMPFVADALGVSINTVRTHLKAVYGKTEVNQQAGLARLIAESFPSLRRAHGDDRVPTAPDRAAIAQADAWKFGCGPATNPANPRSMLENPPCCPAEKPDVGTRE
jgi:DNA-binding CsgD family transcriptional regulator/PAS domain-containing protein